LYPSPILQSSRAAWLHAVHGHNTGFILLKVGHLTDGEHVSLDGTPQQWLPASVTADIFSAAVDRLARHGEVYATVHAYQEPTRRRATNRLPSRTLFLDDISSDGLATLQADGLTPACIVETSPRNHHVYIRLAEAVPVAVARELTRRLVVLTGGDSSSIDTTKLARIPDTVNGKRKHGGFVVRLVSVSESEYTTAELSAVLPSVPPSAPPPPRATGTDTGSDTGGTAATIQLATDANRIDARQLLHDGVPRRISHPRAVAFWKEQRKAGGDQTPSGLRYTAIKSLVMHGYPLDEVAAIIGTLQWLSAGHRSDTALLDDIHRVYHKVRGELQQSGTWREPSPSALKPSGNQPPPIFSERTRSPRTTGVRGRPPTAPTAAHLLQHYQQHANGDAVMLSQRDVAATFGVSQRTINRIEAELAARGVIAIHISACKQYRSVTLKTAQNGNLTCGKNHIRTSTEHGETGGRAAKITFVPEQRAAKISTENVSTLTVSGVAITDTGEAVSQCTKERSTPQHTPPPPPVACSAGDAEVSDTPTGGVAGGGGGVVYSNPADTATAEPVQRKPATLTETVWRAVQSQPRANWREVWQYVQATHPNASETAARRAYEAARDARNRYAPARLTTEQLTVDVRIASAKIKKVAGAEREFWRWRRDAAMAELQRRADCTERLETHETDTGNGDIPATLQKPRSVAHIASTHAPPPPPKPLAVNAWAEMATEALATGDTRKLKAAAARLSEPRRSKVLRMAAMIEAAQAPPPPVARPTGEPQWRDWRGTGCDVYMLGAAYIATNGDAVSQPYLSPDAACRSLLT